MAKVERIYSLLGARIRIGRKRIGAKQIPFAKRVGISRPALVNIELGRQRIMMHDVQGFAKALRTKPHILMRKLWS